MKFFPYRAWQLISKLEKTVGIWPYQTKKRYFSLPLIYTLLFISFAIPLGIRLKNEIGYNRAIVIENALVELLLFIMVFKLILPYLNKAKRKKLYDMIILDWKTITDEKEKKILEQFSDAGYKLTIIYILIVGTDVCVFHGIPIAKMFVKYYMDTNQTRFVKTLTFYVEYYIDHDKYYPQITIHAGIIGVITFVILIAHDMPFIMSVKHVCALFNIISVRLDKASNIFEQYEHELTNVTAVDAIVFNHISSAIAVHNLAFKQVEIIEDAYKMTWFVVTLINTIAFGGLLYILLLRLDQIDDFIRYASTFLALLVHFYLVFLPGQNIIDHSEFVFHICYSCDWYKLSKKSKMLIHIMMIRSLKFSYLTGGGMFVLCMPVYGAMLKSGFSYFTIFAV